MTDDDQSSETQREQDEHTPFGHIFMAGLGGVLVAAIIGVFLYEAFRGATKAPELILTPRSVTQSAAGYIVQVEVRNRGKRTAQALNIEGALKDGQRVVETSSATLAYAPDGSTRSAGLIFQNDPDRYRLTLEAKGYDQP